jgi:hypothetical protein
MALLNSSIPNLLNGVSQQPDALKSPNHCEDQVNAYPSPVEGLIKRQPTEFVTDGLGSDYEGATNTVDTSTHVINRDSDEQYLLTIKGTGTGALSVWDLNANEAKTVYYDTDAISYLTATNSEKAFKFTTGGDVTFITNTEKTTLMSTERTVPSKREGLVHVRQGAYSTDYTISINGTEFKHTTHASTAAEIHTDKIAQDLLEDLNGGAPAYRTDTGVALGAGNDIDVTNGSVPSGQDDRKLRILVDKTDMADLAVGDLIQWENVGTGEFKFRVKDNDVTGGVAEHDFVVGDWFRVATKDSHDTNNFYIELKRWGQWVMVPSDTATMCGTGTGQMRAQTTTSSTLTDFSFTREGSTIHIENTAGEDFELSAQDSVGNTYIKAFKDSTQYFTDLPLEATDGFRIKIEGDVENKIDDYYVKFNVRRDSTFGEGTWAETVAPAEEFKYDYSTMPHILIRQSDGTFLFKPADGKYKPDNVTAGFSVPTKQIIDCKLKGAEDGTSSAVTEFTIDGLEDGLKIKAGDTINVQPSTDPPPTYTILEDVTVENGEAFLQVQGGITASLSDNADMKLNIVEDYRPYKWANRDAGDSITNPDPTFIGTTLNDIFFYENRLGVLSKENVILSESGEFFNFFRTTVIDLLDSAPIDVTSSSNSVANLRHAVPFKGNLILFSDQNQYVLGSGRQALSPKTVAMSQSSYFECNPYCTPTVAGSSVFFPYKRGDYSGVKEMVIQNAEADTYDAFDITDHVPQYIPNEVRHLVSMPQENLLIALPDPTSGTMQDLYLYKYLDVGRKREQSAWFKYSFSLIGDNTDDQKQIIGIHVVDNKLYLVCQYRKYTSSSMQAGSYTYIYKIEIESGKTDSNSVFTTLLDSRVSYDGGNGSGAAAVTASYNTPVSGKTTFTLPFAFNAEDTIIAISKAHSGDAGAATPSVTVLNTVHPTSSSVIIDGNVASNHYWFGKAYTMTYQFAKPVIKGQSRMGVGSMISAGRYQIHSADINYDATHTFTAAVNRMAHSLRKADMNELQAVLGKNLDTAHILYEGIKNSDNPRTFVVDGDPAAIYGVVNAQSDDLNIGWVWLLGTNKIKEAKTFFLKHSKIELAEQEKEYDVLANYVDVRNTVHIKWLKWLGFKALREVNYGVEQRKFYEFARACV